MSDEDALAVCGNQKTGMRGGELREKRVAAVPAIMQGLGPVGAPISGA
jgi:hypothetical protein